MAQPEPRPTAAAQCTARGRGSAVGMTSILNRGQFSSFDWTAKG